MAVLMLLLVGALTACASPAPVSPQSQARSPASIGPKMRVEDAWSQPAVVMEEMAGMEQCQAAEGEVADVDPCEATEGTEPCQATESGMAGMEMAHDTGSRGVVYLTLVNEGDEPDRLIGAQTDVAATAEFHRTIMEEGGMMKMRPVEGGLEIAAGGQVKFEPGSYHIMLVDLKQDLKMGDRFQVVLEFEKSGTLTVESEVRLP